MRDKIRQQLSIVQPYVPHEISEELAQIDVILRALPEIASLVHADLVDGLADPDAGRDGRMSADQVYRALLIKQTNGFSFNELAFHLLDSISFRAFCGLGIGDEAPSASTLCRDFKRILPGTFKQINQLIANYAVEQGIEKGRKVRSDCTVVHTNIHHPTDSSLLEDCVRVLARLISRAIEAFNLDIPFINHHRGARKRALEVLNAKKQQDQVRPYRGLLKLTRNTVGYAQPAIAALALISRCGNDEAQLRMEQLAHFVELTQQVISQTQQRVIEKKKVAALDKVVSIFEPHSDIIIKDRRETHYGHKIALTGGASGLISDVMVLDGNPADATLAVTLIERQEKIYGRVPRQVAFDGGFTSRANLKELKQRLGVKDVGFHKKRGIDEEEMTKSHWVYKSLRNFRAGIEGSISYLKRSFGLRRCPNRGLDSFKSYIWSAVNALNLLLIARHQLT